MFTMDLTVENVDRMIRDFNEYDKEGKKILRREIRQAQNEVTNTARGLIPSSPAMRNWGPWTYSKDGRDFSYNQGAIRSGIKTTVSFKRIGGLYGVMGITRNTTAIGAIFMLAGSRTQNSSFTQRIRDMYTSGPWPRALTPAWSLKVDEVRAKIADAILRAAERVGK